MSYYYSIRGWIEVNNDDHDSIISKLQHLIEELGTDEERKFYLRAWCWVPQYINWTRYIFYGADVQKKGVCLMEEMLQRLTKFEPIEINGLFHVDGEETDSEHITIRIKENKIFKLANEQAHAKGLSDPFLRDESD